MATRSNLIQIYEKLINQDAKHHLQAIRSAGQLYALMLARNTDEAWAPLDKPLKDLDRIQGAPSYLLMLYLLVRREALGIDVAQLEEIAPAAGLLLRSDATSPHTAHPRPDAPVHGHHRQGGGAVG